MRGSCMRLVLRRICAWVVRRLFGSELIGKQCSSLIGDKTVTLSGEFVRAAVHIRFSLLWPILLPRFWPPAVCLSLSLPDGQRVAADFSYVSKRSCRRTRISINLTGSALSDSEYLCIQTERQRDGRLLERIQFHALDLERIARELQVLSLEIYALEGRKHIRCDWLHEEVGQVAFCVAVQIC